MMDRTFYYNVLLPSTSIGSAHPIGLKPAPVIAPQLLEL